MSRGGKDIRFALFCKTFSGDLERFALALDSVERHAASDLRLFISIPRAEHGLFLNRLGTGRFECLCDEDLSPPVFKRGWRNQQLVKLALGRANIADAWLWFDSDGYFVRNFSATDFVRDGKVAMVISHTHHILDDNEAAVLAYLDDPANLPAVSPDVAQWAANGYVARSPWSAKWQRLRDRVFSPKVNDTLARIPPFFGRRGPTLEYLPCSVWTRDSLLSLERHLDANYGWSFSDMIAFAPWEAVWVGEWELFRGATERFFIEPPMLHIRDDATILRARSLGLTESRVATRYFGINLAARHQDIPRLD